MKRVQLAETVLMNGKVAMAAEQTAVALVAGVDWLILKVSS